MGGRGASSGVSVSGKPYGTEYTTVYQSGNIKFLRYNESTAAKSPMETMTSGRVYVTVNGHDVPTVITYYDKANKRTKSIDLTHEHMGKSPHAHEGYIHAENGTRGLTEKERKMVERVLKIWYDRHSK